MHENVVQGKKQIKVELEDDEIEVEEERSRNREQSPQFGGERMEVDQGTSSNDFPDLPPPQQARRAPSTPPREPTARDTRGASPTRRVAAEIRPTKWTRPVIDTRLDEEGRPTVGYCGAKRQTLGEQGYRRVGLTSDTWCHKDQPDQRVTGLIPTLAEEGSSGRAIRWVGGLLELGGSLIFHENTVGGPFKHWFEYLRTKSYDHTPNQKITEIESVPGSIMRGVFPWQNTMHVADLTI